MSSEMLVRVSVFLACLTVLAWSEAVAPRRDRALPRRGRWSGNLGLVLIDTAAVRLVSPVTAVGIALLAEENGWGAFQALAWPGWVSGVAAVVLLDLTIYGQHVASHAVPALWRLHRVHHTDLDVDVTTGVRFHPIEMLLSVGVKAVAVAALGAPVVSVVAFEVLLNAGSLFSHANLRLPVVVDRALRRCLVTPDMHRVHHSIDPAEREHNYAFTFAWWDRLFGTYRAQPTEGHERMALGVDGFSGPAAVTLARLLVQPLGDGQKQSKPRPHVP